VSVDVAGEVIAKVQKLQPRCGVETGAVEKVDDDASLAHRTLTALVQTLQGS
jgi:hypothetical protein